jgi:hypothetical protein
MPFLRFSLPDGQIIDREVDDQKIFIGRHPQSDIVVTGGSVSTRHALVRRRDDVVTIEDLGSTNGTEVNGKEIDEATLEHGDFIAVGDVRGIYFEHLPENDDLLWAGGSGAADTPTDSLAPSAAPPLPTKDGETPPPVPSRTPARPKKSGRKADVQRQIEKIKTLERQDALTYWSAVVVFSLFAILLGILIRSAVETGSLIPG